MRNLRKRVSKKEFSKAILEIRDILHKSIELSVEAFDVDEQARADRLEKANCPKDGFRFFCETYFPHYLTSEPSDLHEKMFEVLPEIVLADKGQKDVFIAPRAAAKSTIGNLAFALWCLLTERKHYICIVMDVFDQAAIALEAIKAELEINPRLSYDFPGATGKTRKWREDKIITKNNRMVEAFGALKKIRGRRHGPYRPDLVICDDLENDEEVENPKLRDKLMNYIFRSLLKLGPTDGSMDFIYLGTVLHHDAVIVRLANKPGWQRHIFRAILEWPKRMDLWEKWEEIYLSKGELSAQRFYEQNKEAMCDGAKLNWPKTQGLYFLMCQRADSHAAFESEYQNNPISEDAPFKSLSFWVQESRDWIYFGGIDPSLGRQNRHRDPSAILVVGVDLKTKVMDVVEASIVRRLPDIIIADAIQMQRQYNCLMWFVETIQYQEFLRTELVKRSAKANVAMPCKPIQPVTDKNLRIMRLQPPVADGMIRFSQSHSTLINQIQQFPHADHDDGPDCLEMIYSNALAMAETAASSSIFRRPQKSHSAFNLNGFR